MPVEEIRMLSFSVKSARGMVVVKRLLDMLSAAELSDKVGILIGIRNPGWKRVATKTKAIWANVSRLEISGDGETKPFISSGREENGSTDACLVLGCECISNAQS